MTQKQIQIEADTKEIQGVYSNLLEIKHTQEEFCLDFFNLFPPVGALVSRIIVSPGHLKRMIRAFQDNLKKYEQRFGTVQEAKAPHKEEGFGFEDRGK